MNYLLLLQIFVPEIPTDGPAAGPSTSTEPVNIANPFLAMEAFLKTLMLSQNQLQTMPESMTETNTQATGSYSAASPVASPAASPAAGPDIYAASPVALAGCRSRSISCSVAKQRHVQSDV